MWEVLGHADLLARIGGDEFVIVLDEVRGIDHAVVVAEAIHYAMRAPITMDDEEEIFAAMSVGARTCEHASAVPSDLLRDADIAMYEAKREGGGRTIAFTDELYLRMVERLKLQTALHRVG